MAKSATAGELRTPIRVFRPDKPLDEHGQPKTDSEGYPIVQWVNVFGCGGVRHVKWEGAWGREVYEARQAGVIEPATVTMRYTRAVTPDCIVYKGDDPRPYEIISGINDVDERHQWIEFKVQRKAVAV